MIVRFSHVYKILFISLLLTILNDMTAFSVEKEIGGVINKYARVTIVTPPDRVTVSNVTDFSAGDTILLIQMQGVEILTANDGSYGNIQNTTGTPGGYEFLIIQSVNGGTNEITFRNNMIRSYNVNGIVQIVSVPYYNNANVTSTLTSDPWDDPSNPNTGGVLALIVGRSLNLNADIDVSGKGFKGGNDTTGTGFCIATNPSVYGLYSYPRTSPNAGYKGEGIAVHDELGTLLDPLHVLGMGPNYSGGGGGNGRFSGGGGGSNRGTGGLGGYESGECLNVPLSQFPQPGGMGGLSVNSSLLLRDGIFLGGGGGSSTRTTGTATPGGRGGGIVIIVTDTIIGNGRSIKANGANANGATLNGGAGGGGGGGSIVLSLQSYSNKSLTINANGGNGGAHSGFGGGGGGGGGFIWVSTAVPGTVTQTTSGGLSGTSATSGTAGETRGSFKVLLNGFLFNSIRSSVTGNLNDSICSNVVPKLLTGTLPVGGNSPYTYEWTKSYDDVTFIPIASSNTQNYLPTIVETSTVYYRRTITDSSTPTALVDVSKSVKVTVQPYIKNNIVGTSDIICYGQDPPTFNSTATLLDGNGIYSFKWQVSLNNSIYNLPSNEYNAESYTPPPALIQSSWYRRTVVSGRCIDSTAIVNITVLDTISNNRILSAPQDICYGMTFTNLSATVSPVLDGGDNSYRFKWESNINGAGWELAPGVSNAAGYNPAELTSRVPMNEYYFRRVVYSGTDDVCVNTSKPVLLKDFPVITNNYVTTVPPVCSGSVPAKLIGSAPLNGNGIYTYSWQDSTKLHTWALIPGENNPDFQPPALTDSTRYRRIVNSSACSNTSKSITIIVHKPVLNNNINLISLGADTTICYGSTPNILLGSPASGGTNIPGDYAYEWWFSTDNINFNPVTGSGTNLDYQPGVLYQTTYFKRKAISGQCSPFSSVIRINVLPLITNNTISGSQQICINSAPLQLTGSIPVGGAGVYNYLWEQSVNGVQWLSATGNNTGINYQPPAISVPMKYRRKVFSGANNCCSSIMTNVTDWVSITLWMDIDTIYAGPDKFFYSFEYVDTLEALRPVLGTGIWSTVSSSGNPEFDEEEKYNTIVRNMGPGLNILEWTVSNGACVKKDQVTIEILDLLVPEGFSPNGDAINDEFEILGLDIGNNTARLIVINGYGSQVFKDDDYKGKWNGFDNNGNELPDGTYYYMLTIQSDRLNETYKGTGFIILKR